MKDTKMGINRREAIKQAAYFMGGAISAPTILGVLQGCSADPKTVWTPTFFSESQALTVQELAEAILPATDTLGAKDLGVPKFVEEMVSVVYSEADRKRFVEGLAAFEKEVNAQYKKSYGSLNKEEKLAVAKEQNAVMQDPENQGNMSDSASFFRTMKELTLTGYFTTEYGATQVLQFQLIPAEFQGCIPIEEAGEGGRTYAV